VKARNTFLVLTILLATTLVVAAASAEIVFPGTRAGEIAKAYFESLNSGAAETIKAFETTYRSAGALEKRPIAERIPRVLGLHDQIGTLVPMVITKDDAGEITIAVRSEKLDMWLSCAFEIETEAPHKLVSVTMRPTSPPEMSVGDITEWTDLADLVAQVRAETGIPAIAVAIVEDGRITEQAVGGVRSIATEESVEKDDEFHIGSVGKSVTATMIGALVENGVVDWEDTIAQRLEGMEMREAYRDVMLEQLLQHRGGIPGYLTFSDEEEARLDALPGTPTEQRATFVAEVLQDEPVERPGTRMVYSNAGYAIACLMAERASGKSWEILVNEYVFDPLDMETADVGWPASETSPDQPRGHFLEGSSFRVQELGEYPMGSFLAPAGDIHCAIGDLATYAQFHLNGLRGQNGPLQSATVRRLHTPPDTDENGKGYAAGWMIEVTDGMGPKHYHSGSAGTFFATIELYPDQNRAIVIAMNAGAGAGMAAGEKISAMINARLHQDAQ